MDINKLINSSIEWRFSKISNHSFEAVRLFSGSSDGIEGLLIDQFGPFILVCIYNPKIKNFKNQILKYLSEYFPKKSILIKMRTEKDINKYSYFENRNYKLNDILYCTEGGLSFEIHTDPRHDFGIYLDTKASRNFLTKISKNKTVLNLFSYTCAFGLAAMEGQATSVTNIDPNKEYLNWGKKNADLNNFILKRYPDTTQDYLKRHIRRIENNTDKPYDITIIDPPAFLIGRGQNRLSRNQWPTWMKYLKEGQSKELIVIINDKSLIKKQNLSSFFSEGLGNNIKISIIEQSFDVQGQLLVNNKDSYYFNPLAFYIKRI